MERLQQLQTQINSNLVSAPYQKRDDDVVICYSKRTALTKSKKGLLKDTLPEVLLTQLFKDLLNTTKIPANEIQDIVIGNVLQPGAGMYPIRFANFLAGIPETTPVASVNRLCSSGLEAVAIVAAKIKANMIDIGIAGGVEQMSLYDMSGLVDAEKVDESVFEHEQARNCLQGMGQTSENVAEKFGVTRKDQDVFAVESQRRAAFAQKNGLYKEEILLIHTKVKDADGNSKDVVCSQDDGIRESTLENMAKLKPSFKKDGTTTAGNSSQLTDGAAIVLVAKRITAKKFKLPIISRFVDYSVVGVPPELMGIGPAFAIPAVLKKANLNTKDIDIYEINEAFASQASYCCKKLNLDLNKVNPKGGAIALGHPLGCTGSRLIATLMSELKRTKGKYGVVSMCIGTGMGAAAIFENEQL